MHKDLWRCQRGQVGAGVTMEGPSHSRAGRPARASEAGTPPATMDKYLVHDTEPMPSMNPSLEPVTSWV